MNLCSRTFHCVRGFEPSWAAASLIALLFVQDGFTKDPHSPSAASYLQRGGEHYSHGDLDQAIADYEIALTFDPHYAKAYNCRGLARWTKGQVDGAIDDYTLALQYRPQVGGSL